MKYIWEAGDIKAGRIVGSDTRNKRWIIGYLAADVDDHPKRYVLISMADGMVQPSLTAEEMSVFLNSMNEAPGEMLGPWSKPT